MNEPQRQLPGLLVVLSGPAGVGKTTVAEELLKRDESTERSVSATTRKMRAGEVDGRDYHFVSKSRFADWKRRAKLIETAVVHGSSYGTPRQPLRESLARNQVVLLVIDVDGGKQVAAQELDALLLFLAPPSLDALKQRLKGRASENTAQQTLRLSRAELEMAKAKEYYDHTVINDDLQACVDEVAVRIEERRHELARRLEAGETLYRGLGPADKED